MNEQSLEARLDDVIGWLAENGMITKEGESEEVLSRIKEERIQPLKRIGRMKCLNGQRLEKVFPDWKFQNRNRIKNHTFSKERSSNFGFAREQVKISANLVFQIAP